jgi:hypothetical protein
MFNINKISLFSLFTRRHSAIDSLTKNDAGKLLSPNGRSQNSHHQKNEGEHSTLESESKISHIINSISDINLSSPPGLAGVICRDIELFEHRALPALRPLVAPSAMSFLARHIKCFGGGNLRFFALGIALSAAGKEAHQTYLKMVMKSADLANKIAGKPRSDKNIYQDVVNFEETMYLVDEVHSFFKQASNSSAASFESGMISVLLELSTSESFVFPSKIINELKAQYQNELQRLEDNLSAPQKEKERLERILSRLSEGWDEPYVQFTGYSTPINMKNIYNKVNIEQGLIARIITLLAPDKREKFTGRQIDQPSEAVLNRLHSLIDKDSCLTISHEAECYLSSLTDYFELDEILNHPHLGALYARGRKMVLLIASILAVETGEIQLEYLRYAFALFLYNVKACERFFMPNNSDSGELYKEAERVATGQVTKNKLSRAQLANKMTQCSTAIKEHRMKSQNICYELIDRLCSDGVIQVSENIVYLVKKD